MVEKDMNMFEIVGYALVWPIGIMDMGILIVRNGDVGDVDDILVIVESLKSMS